MALQYVLPHGSESVVILMSHWMQFCRILPWLRLEGLNPEDDYDVAGYVRYSGAGLMERGLAISFEADFDSTATSSR